MDSNQIVDLEEFLEETDVDYQKELIGLQLELLNLQKYIVDTGQRVIILFEGRDTAGKGGAIQRYTQYLNPRHLRVVALGKPSEEVASQWYFQKYVKHFPAAGEMVLFDRSWYNRAIVEPALGFCTEAQYKLFMKQVLEFEKMIVDEGISFIKFWFSIDLQEQKRRLAERKENPLKQWKLSSTDLLAHEKFEVFSDYRKKMFAQTSPVYATWVRIKGNNKKVARLESIKYLLSRFDNPNKGISNLKLNFNDQIIKIVQETN